jgi:O-antigen/teichoic acid export membrane protein
VRHLIAARLARMRADSLTRNSVGIMATSAVNAALGYIYWIVVARALPASTVGLGSSVVSAMVIVSLAIYLGPGSGLIARLPSRTTRDAWLLSVLSMLLECSAATLVLAIGVLFPLALLLKPLRPLGDDGLLAAWYVLGAVGWTASGLLDCVFVAQRRADFMFWRNAFSSVFKLLSLLVLAVLPDKRGATTIVATWALSGIVGTGYGLYLCHRHFYRLGRIPHPGRGLRAALREEAWLMARPSLGHHAISVSGLLPTYLLPIVVTARLGTRENAYFYVTWMIGSSIFMISPAVSAAIFAEGSYDATRMRTLARDSMRIIMAMIVPSTLIVGALGRPILHLYGADYAAAGYGLLLILLLSSYPDAVTNISVATLRVQGELRRASALNGVMAVVAVAGAWVLAPIHGIDGVGSAWLIAQTVGTVGVVVLHKKLWPVADGVD